MPGPISTVLLLLTLPAGVFACKSNEPSSATTSARAVDVAITPTGEAQVTLKDDRGQLVASNDVTGKVEFADGQSIALTPDVDGRMLRAPMGAHMENVGGCMAVFRVQMRGRAEATRQVDLCQAHAGHGHNMMGTGTQGMPGGHGPSHE